MTTMNKEERAALREAASKLQAIEAAPITSREVAAWTEAASIFRAKTQPAAVLSLLDECERMREALVATLLHLPCARSMPGADAPYSRALPPPADAAAALAEVVRRAKEEEREAIALWFDGRAINAERNWQHQHDRWGHGERFVSQMRDAAAAIRARTGGAA